MAEDQESCVHSPFSFYPLGLPPSLPMELVSSSQPHEGLQPSASPALRFFTSSPPSSFRGLTSLATDSSAVLPCWHQGLESLFLPFGISGLTIGLLLRRAVCSELSAFSLLTKSLEARLYTVCDSADLMPSELSLVAYSLSQQNLEEPSLHLLSVKEMCASLA